MPARSSSNASNAVDGVLSKLRALITEGALSPGEQIRQREMAERFGVSRVPLREALNVLAAQGLLEHRSHSGYFVSKRTPDEIRQIRRLLELLEDELLVSLQWPDAPLLAELRALNDRMRECAASHDWQGLIGCNRSFHFRIFALSRDTLILEAVRRLWTLADPLIAIKLSTPEAGARAVAEHDDILAALVAQDRARTQALMTAHRRSTQPVMTIRGLYVPPEAVS